MNEFVSAGAAFLIALVLWGLGKKPKKLFNSNATDYTSPTEVTCLVQTKNDSPQKESSLNTQNLLSQLPKTPKERVLLRQNLKKLIASSPEERLIAIQKAHEWGDHSVIPILKIGLKDSDSRVVLKAAEGISKFRCHSKTQKKKPQKSLPLNVSRMR